MPTFVDPDKRHPYVFESDRDKPEGDRPVFYLRVPPLSLQEALTEKMLISFGSDAIERAKDDPTALTAGSGGAMAMLSIGKQVLRGCWVGVDGWRRSDGSLVLFDAEDDGGASDKMLTMLTSQDRAELMAQCLRIMSITDTDQD